METNEAFNKKRQDELVELFEFYLCSPDVTREGTDPTYYLTNDGRRHRVSAICGTSRSGARYDILYVHDMRSGELEYRHKERLRGNDESMDYVLEVAQYFTKYYAADEEEKDWLENIGAISINMFMYFYACIVLMATIFDDRYAYVAVLLSPCLCLYFIGMLEDIYYDLVHKFFPRDFRAVWTQNAIRDLEDPEEWGPHNSRYQPLYVRLRRW